MADFTENYGLHQWEPTDPFLREDFNQDFNKIDTALNAAAVQDQNMLTRLERVDYHLYNLMLQNQYEGHYTGYKKALLCDGFTDESGVAERSDSMVVAGGSVWLYRTSQGDLDLGDYGNSADYYCVSQEVTTTNPGRLSGFTCKIMNDTSSAYAPTLDAELSCNGEVVRTETFTAAEIPRYSSEVQSFTFRESVSFGPGDTLQLSLRCSGNQLYRTSSYKLAGVLNVQSTGGTAGTLLTRPITMPECKGLQVWVRHKSGTVGLTLECGEETFPLTSDESRTTTELLSGSPCTEQSYSLERDLPAGSWSFRLDASLSSGQSGMQIHDYGAVML